MDTLTGLGLALTLAGALVLSLRDLTGGRVFRQVTYADLIKGLPRAEVRIGFPLIAIGTALQLAALIIG